MRISASAWIWTAGLLLCTCYGGTPASPPVATADETTLHAEVVTSLIAAQHLTGNQRASNVTVNATAVGSGVNGPQTSQTGMSINATKDGWFAGTAAVGELDGLYVTTRQGGAGSDSSGLLVDVGNTGMGFLSATEMVSNIIDPVSNSITHGIDVQDAVLNKVTGDFIGRVFNADHGKLSTAILVQSAGGYWGKVLVNLKDGKTNFVVDDDGNLNAGKITASGPVAPGAATFAALPAAGTPGRTLFCSDCLKPGEAAGAGTGMLVFDDGRAWFSTAGTAAAH